MYTNESIDATEKNQQQNNEEKDPGWGAVSNEMFSFFAQSDCTERELKIALFLMRSLNGWRLRYAPITIKEFLNGTLLEKSNLIKALKSLVNKGLITKIKLETGKTYHYGFTDRFYVPTPIGANRIAFSVKNKVVKSTTNMVVKSTTMRVVNLTTYRNMRKAPTAVPKDSKDILKKIKELEEINLSENGEHWPESTPTADVSAKVSEIINGIFRNKQLNNPS